MYWFEFVRFTSEPDNYLEELSFDVVTMSDSISIARACSLQSACFLREINFVSLARDHENLSHSRVSSSIVNQPYISHPYQFQQDEDHYYPSRRDFARQTGIISDDGSHLYQFQQDGDHREEFLYDRRGTSFLELARQSQYGNISDKGFRAIADSLQKCCRLRVVKCDSKFESLAYLLPKKKVFINRY